MTTYIITWRDSVFGQSVVEANSEEEAKKMAEAGEDYDFESDDCPAGDWEIDSVTKYEGDCPVVVLNEKKDILKLIPKK